MAQTRRHFSAPSFCWVYPQTAGAHTKPFTPSTHRPLPGQRPLGAREGRRLGARRLSLRWRGCVDTAQVSSFLPPVVCLVPVFLGRVQGNPKESHYFGGPLKHIPIELICIYTYIYIMHGLFVAKPHFGFSEVTYWAWYLQTVQMYLFGSLKRTPQDK